VPVGDQPEIEQDPRFARAGIVRDNLGGEPQALMERDRSGVGRGGDGLRPDGSLVAGAFEKSVVEKSPYTATSLTLPGCDEVNVGQPVGLVLMGSDTPNGMDYTPGTNYSVSLSGEDETELRGYWEQLSAAATITMPLNKAPWGDTFGMCVDKFGVNWLVNIVGPKS